MNVLEELKKKVADIETQSLAMDGCRPTFTVSEIMDLIDSVEFAQNSPNACTDTIYRQTAIDAVEKESQVDGAYGYMDTKSIVDLLNALPPAEPDHIAEDSKKVSFAQGQENDSISRREAINYCYQLINVEYQQGSDEMNYGQERINQTETILHHLEFMPSAQLETITCNQCVHYQQSHHYCELLDTEFSPSDYCSYAEREEE